MMYILRHIYFWVRDAYEAGKAFCQRRQPAVRLPSEFRFDGTDEVYIRRDTVTGDVILSARPGGDAWSEFFSLRDQAGVPSDFAEERPLNTPLQPRDLLQER